VITPETLTRRDGTTAYRIRWRYGGKRTGPPQSVTFKEADFQDDAIVMIRSAAALVAARNRRVTAEEIYADLLGSGPAPDEGPTLNEWFAIWARQKVGVEPGVLHRYRQDWAAHIAEGIGKRPIAEISRHDIKEWVLELAQKPGRGRDGNGRPNKLSARSIHKQHALLHQVLGAAVYADLIGSNIAEGTPLPKQRHGKTSDERVFLSPEEAGLLLAAFRRDRDRDLVEVLLHTGLRWSEATALQGGDLDLSVTPARLRVQRAWKFNGTKFELATPGPDKDELDERSRFGLGAPKSERSRRTITVDEGTAAILSRYADAKNPQRLLWANRDGGRMDHGNWLSDQWKPAVARARGLDPKTGKRLPAKETKGKVLLAKDPRGPHSCRHTHAAWLLSDGVSMTRVSRRLGHDSESTTDRFYGHLLPSDDEDVMASSAAARRRQVG
jgi:integrase